MTFWTEPDDAARPPRASCTGSSRYFRRDFAARAGAPAGARRGRRRVERVGVGGRRSHCRRSSASARSAVAYASARHAPPSPSTAAFALAVLALGALRRRLRRGGRERGRGGRADRDRRARLQHPDHPLPQPRRRRGLRVPRRPAAAEARQRLPRRLHGDQATTSDEARPSATGFTVVDTLDNEFDPVESESPYALDDRRRVPAEVSFRCSNTTAQTGPNQGSLLIFPVRDDVSDNRPLRARDRDLRRRAATSSSTSSRSAGRSVSTRKLSARADR